MAESHVSDVFKDYKKEIEEEDIHTGRDYANQVQPLLKRYTGTEHSKTEDKQMCEDIETLITALEKKVTVEKDRISELRAAEIKILKDNVDFDLDCELRPEHKRANNNKDSGCYSITSTDSRLFTDNKNLVTYPANDAELTENSSDGKPEG